ncbi:MAG: hypothetical protein EWV50_21770 [Microcystis aeruginosa Ma_MB_F_20061100_S20]|uniref:Uncharacterized protein n=1 Tax=Microcystis aeruginosa Ma_MB_F_20061100_S20D TaxID=2486253 RepID=A0A552EEM7_MICAE|nr:MAG: hypothetical protein EWV50_21770 [Microcystis aeruginosa Ma_MB_F_20061100_S20]TRU32940.1 MAG: hypothetical protein EWV78_16570 [Microcystis aeruginosa Ma_MB_F_20061100_S20D]
MDCIIEYAKTIKMVCLFLHLTGVSKNYFVKFYIKLSFQHFLLQEDFENERLVDRRTESLSKRRA